MKARRIAVFSKQLDNWHSGSGHHLNEIMHRVLALNEGRFDFTFIHYAKSDNDIYHQVRELILPRNPLLAGSALRREHFDLVHYTPLTVYAPIWGVPNKKVATVHGVEQLLLPEFFGALEMWHERHLVPLYCRKMDGIFTVSNTTADYLTEHFKVKRDRIAVGYNGIGSEYRVLEKSEARASCRFPVTSPFVFHVSRFSERKNPWTLLSSFAILREKYGYTGSLVCAGKGWDCPEVALEVKRLGLEGHFLAPGFVTDRDIAVFFNLADLFAFPSLAEGFGMPNVEAMASGCPVVTSSAFAIPEVVGDAAIVVANPRDAEGFASAMHRVITDPALASGMREKGFGRASLCNWDAAAKTLLALYSRVLDSGF